ncbi:MAG TPA: hypothetical protein VGT03_15975 [Candidatus Acidoferrales bacterium]|nr:hypothetical protein [Candidatus Acidoferrales bacterium]
MDWFAAEGGFLRLGMIETIQGSVDSFGETDEGVGFVVGGLWLIGLWSGGLRGNGLILGLLRHCFSPLFARLGGQF